MSSNPSENPERQAFTGELRELLEWAIDTLPDGMREVFVLREVEGLSTSEVAECLGVSEDVVKTRLSRGRAALRRVLLERTGATAPEAFRFYRPRCDRVVAQVLRAGLLSSTPNSARRPIPATLCHLSSFATLITEPRDRDCVETEESRIDATHRCCLNRIHPRDGVRRVRIRVRRLQAEQTAATSEQERRDASSRTARRSSASTPSATSSCGPTCCGCTRSFRPSIRRRRWRSA